MFQHREIGLNHAYQFATTVLLSVCFWVWFLILQYGIPGVELAGVWDYFEFYVALILGLQISFMAKRRQDIFSVTSGVVESHQLVRPHFLFAAGMTFLFLVLKKDDAISRTFLFTFLPLAYVALVVFTRFFAFPILHALIRQRVQKLLLVGKPEELPRVESLLEKARFFGLCPMGILTESAPGELPPEIPKLGEPDDLERLLGPLGVENIFILGSPRDRRVLGRWMLAAERKGCRVSMVNDLDLFLQRPISYFRCDDIDLIELREEPLQNSMHRFLKRVFDIAVSLPVVIFVFPPLMLVVWILQRRQAPGPLFFRQVRSGLDNHPFTILKFRTMFVEHCDTEEQVRNGDSRIFPSGRFLRRFSLDEFPQFWNVLTGQMSVVGPRPHMVQHDRLFAEKMASYAVRGFVKPGLSGLAQIRGLRGETITPEDVVRRVESDIEYIENWSLVLDVRIIWQTLLQLFRPPKTAV